MMVAPGRAHDPAAGRRARTVSPSRARQVSRSPRPSVGAGPTGADRPVPDSAGTADWHEGKPGPSCSVEDLRWFTIREIGKSKETARFAGRHILNLQTEVDALKGRVDAKAEANLVVNEFDKLRADTRAEILKIQAELDHTGLEARMVAVNDLAGNFGTQVQDAFKQVATVEPNLQAHATQGFS